MTTRTLPPQVAVGVTAPLERELTEPACPGTGLVRAIAAVDSLQQFLALLGTSPGADVESSNVSGLPGNHKPLAVAALGVRILALPANEQHAAIESFLELACGCGKPWPPLLQQLMTATKRGVRGLLARERDVASTLGRAAIRRGEGVRVVAQRLGISSRTWMSFLESLATCGPGLRAIAQGERFESVVHRLQITDVAHVALLRCTGVSGAVARGENVLAAARRLDITDSAVLLSLERVATFSPGFKAVAQGEDALATALRLGISHPANVTALIRKQQEQGARR